MKKKILFLCSNMEVGGFQKSLISLLSYFDYENYEVDLLLFNPKGIFMDVIPENVNILESIVTPTYFEKFPACLIGLIKEREFLKGSIRFLGAACSRIDRGYGAIIMSKAIPALKKKYDVIIDYNGQYSQYYMIDKLISDKKITYFHSDYRMWDYYQNADVCYYEKSDYIVTVSEECVNSIKNIFPKVEYKVKKIENIISERTVNLFPINSNNYTDQFSGTRIVTVGRACKAKGLDLALHAIKLLLENGYNVRWYWIGPIEDEEKWQKMIENYDIKGCFVFLGSTNNPYDYMRNADIIVHPSRFEGKSVAIEEAKILRKPIVATNFSTVRNQIENELTGLVVNMDGYAIFEGIQRLIKDAELKNQIINYLSENVFGNENEVDKLYKLIEF